MSRANLWKSDRPASIESSLSAVMGGSPNASNAARPFVEVLEQLIADDLIKTSAVHGSDLARELGFADPLPFTIQRRHHGKLGRRALHLGRYAVFEVPARAVLFAE